MQIRTKYLIYDTLSGVFTWRIKRKGRCKKGNKAGSRNSEGYIQIIVNGKMYKAHHIAWRIVHGEFPPKGMEVDHENGVRHDNAITNLRLVDDAGNAKNQMMNPRNTSGVMGVMWSKAHQKWIVRIGNVYLGIYRSKAKAIRIRRQAEIDHKYHPNHGKR